MRQYSCVYVILNTDNPDLPAGYGLTFTLGRGNEIVSAMCTALEHLVVGLSLEDDILSDLMTFSRTLTQDGQLRWIGPEKGVLALACGAILNAVWDMWSRKEGKPLWEMVCDMEPAQLIECIDFKHITDVITPEEALELLESKRPGWESRKKHMQEDGCALPSSSVHRAHKKLTHPAVRAQTRRTRRARAGSATPRTRSARCARSCWPRATSTSR